MSMDSYDYIMTGKSYENSQRIEKLKQLCCDMYAAMRKSIGTMSAADADCFDEKWTARMNALGLLEGEQND